MDAKRIIVSLLVLLLVAGQVRVGKLDIAGNS